MQSTKKMIKSPIQIEITRKGGDETKQILNESNTDSNRFDKLKKYLLQ